MTALRDLLQKVAAGELDAEEAAELMEEMDRSTGPAIDSKVADVRVHCEVGAVTVVGDPTVREAVAEGRHTARFVGQTLVVDAELQAPGFVFLPRPSRLRHELTVRANPALPLDIQMGAGSATVRGMTGPISASVGTGRLAVEGFRSPIDLNVEAGNITATGRLDSGMSRVRCEVGRVSLRLESGCSLQIDARSDLGRVSLPGEKHSGRRPTSTSTILGDGAGTLDVKMALGDISIRHAGE